MSLANCRTKQRKGLVTGTGKGCFKDNWWKPTFEDAETVGLKIKSFGLDRDRHATGEFIMPAHHVADAIINNHGESCETFKTAQRYIADCAPIEARFRDENGNVTDDDAERLQKLWNDRARENYEKGNQHQSAEAKALHSASFKPSTVCRITQVVYSQNSDGAYAKAETRELCISGFLNSRYYGATKGTVLCKLRTTWGDGNTYNKANRVIILTDKPKKPLPSEVCQEVKETVTA